MPALALLVVRDPEIKKTIGGYYKRAWDEVVRLLHRQLPPDVRCFSAALSENRC